MQHMMTQPDASGSHSVPATAMTWLITLYQRIISPFLGQTCRFYPSCSEYAKLTIRKDGAIRGAGKAAWRILRCNPLSKGGIDYP